MKKIIMSLMLFGLLGCEQAVETPAAEQAAPAHGALFTGTVAETLDVENYTYLRIDQQGREVWLATTPVKVEVGAVVAYSDAGLMKDFYSQTLDRTFPSIIFANSIQVNGKEIGAVSPRPAAPASNPHEDKSLDAAVFDGPVAVEALDGGKTVGQIIAESAAIEGQQVSLRARVIKVSANILGKNWVTLKDGTGTAPDDKLVATTQETVTVGDEYVVTGLVRSDVDIGAGYTYKVLLEDTQFSR